MKQHFFDFMQKVIDNRQSELAPPTQPRAGVLVFADLWLIPPPEAGGGRVVFDSSVEYKGTSLNDVLLSGPNLNNTLHGVLLRFRREQVVAIADVEQMFYGFKVREDHCHFLRFLWHKDNDPDKEIIDYWMTVHVFGNSPSPAVATYGLRKAAEQGEAEHGSDAKEFVFVNGLISLAKQDEVIDLLQRTKALLTESNLKLQRAE